jgi:hypothetical protein
MRRSTSRYDGIVSVLRFVGVALACSLVTCTPTLPPYGQALLIIDTDVAIPRIVNRLRVDVKFPRREREADAPATAM